MALRKVITMRKRNNRLIISFLWVFLFLTLYEAKASTNIDKLPETAPAWVPERHRVAFMQMLNDCNRMADFSEEYSKVLMSTPEPVSCRAKGNEAHVRVMRHTLESTIILTYDSDIKTCKIDNDKMSIEFKPEIEEVSFWLKVEQAAVYTAYAVGGFALGYLVGSLR